MTTHNDISAKQGRAERAGREYDKELAQAESMGRFSVAELRGMVAEGCQGHAEANAALAEMVRRLDDCGTALAMREGGR